MNIPRNYIDIFKDAHKDQDIYVIAAGSSMELYPEGFFDDKVTVGVNRVCNFFDCDYTVIKDFEGFNLILQNTINKNIKVIMSEHRYGTRPSKNPSIDSSSVFYFHHFDKPGQRPMVKSILKDSNKLVVSHSTITSSIHFSAYMGAKNIFICAHDCCKINNESTIENYYSKIKPHQKSDKGYVDWLKTIKYDTFNVSEKLQKEYECNIVALNPMLFVNFDKYEIS